MQADLFSDYPTEPGAKGRTRETRETSTTAGQLIRVNAATIREAVENLFTRGFVGTPDQAAARLGLELHTVRSRISELIADHVLEPTGEKRTNRDTGKLAAVVRAKSCAA